MSGPIVDSIRAEYTRYKALAEGAFVQLTDEQICTRTGPSGNSIATIVWHLSGNYRSRFTDFLTTDGEKPDRKREEEFEARVVPRAELLAKWEAGWSILFASVDALTDEDLTRTVTIRRQPLLVHEALHRALGHTAYHVGQIILLGKMHQGDGWKYLSIPPGQSDIYNQNPDKDKPGAHASTREVGAGLQAGPNLTARLPAPGRSG